jgi:hypothetical protein
MNDQGSGIRINMFNPGATTQPPNMGDINSPVSQSGGAAKSYTIQPVVWMFVFLIVGYLGLRWLNE